MNRWGDTVGFLSFEPQLSGLKPLLMAHTNMNVRSVALRGSLWEGRKCGGTERLKGRCSLCVMRWEDAGWSQIEL